MLGNSNPTLAGERLKETAIPLLAPLLTIAATVITDVIHVGLGLGGMCVATVAQPWSFLPYTSNAARNLGWWGRAAHSPI
jgi:hypothetical protein